MLPGKTYLFKLAAKLATGTVQTLHYRVDVNTLHRQDAPVLELNDIGRCTVTLTEPVAFDDYRRNRERGRPHFGPVTNGRQTFGTAGTRTQTTKPAFYQRYRQRAASGRGFTSRSSRSGGTSRFGK